MNTLSTSYPTAALAAAIALFHGPSALGQEPAKAGKELLAKIDAARVPAAKLANHTLRIEGTYTVKFEGAANDAPAAEGPFTDLFAGPDLARHTSGMGDFGAMERGLHRDVVWEVDPTMGAKVLGGSHAAATRRYMAVLRGTALASFYKEAVHTGTERIDGREHGVVRLQPNEGAADVAYVDADGTIARIDMALPTPESADAALGIDDAQLARIEFADWQTIDGVRYAQRRTLAMGPAIVSFACKKIEVGAKIDAATFEPPAAVAKAKPAASEPAFDKDGKPNYQIVERPAQAVASVRVKCKPSEISSRLGEILPEILTHITSTGGKMAGPPYSRYHAFSDAEIDLEAGIPVAKPITEKGRIKNGELPGGKLVTCWHIGSYEKLTGTHQGLQAHLTAKQFKARGGPWEVYWTDPGMVQDQSKWRTQLFVAIE